MVWQVIGQAYGQFLSNRHQRKESARGHSRAMSQAEYGNELDNESYMLRDRYDWMKARKRGLTPQEFYGSAAAGGSATTGTNAVLGNQAMQRAQINADAYRNAMNQTLDAAVQLRGQDMEMEKARLQADTAKETTGMQTDAQRYSAELVNDIANKNYRLAKQRLKQIEVPKLLAELKINERQYKILTNEIATSDPKFQLYMKKLSMGVDNMMVEFLQHSFGVNITDPKSVQKMTKEQRRHFIEYTAALNSSAFKEVAGASKAAWNILDKAGDGVSNLVDGLNDMLPEFNLGNFGSTKKRKGGSVSHLPGPKY